MSGSHRILRCVACAALLLVAPGCGEHLERALGVGAAPEVRITETAAQPGRPGLETYALRWTGDAPAGRVDHYLVAVDPRRLDVVDSCWKATRESRSVLSFPADELLQARASRPARRDFHLFAVRSVDSRGAVSLPATRAFFPGNVAPTVQILSPRPSPLLFPTVPPELYITWQGYDPDGAETGYKPVKYKYKLYARGSSNPWNAWLQDPDSLRRQVAPEFAGWDSVDAGPGPAGPDTARVQFTNLTPNSEYLFVAVAIDAAGDYSPVFGLDTNMLGLNVVPQGSIGPRITLFNSTFSYTYPSGGYPSPLDPSWAIRVQVPGRQPVTFNWTAVPSAGSAMRRYRWAMDIADLQDETPRTGPSDWSRWSDWDLATTSATVGPFAARGLKREAHDFYVEAEDINGLVSLGWVRFVVVHPTFDRDLLVVNDTRFRVDQASHTQPAGRTDSLMAPFGAWPTCAELDTFLFAMGGVRWRMTPAGRLSPPGIFKGYRFDTLGTRYGLSDPTINLGVLGEYRHVVWMTDRAGSLMDGSPTSLTLPTTTLLYMSRPNRQSTLATWVGQGGRLWALGSGFGNATNSPWNNLNNDLNQVRTYTSQGARPDLAPGRFMYDLAHWRSEFRSFGPVFVRFARYDQPDPTVGYPRPATYWTGGVFTNPDVNYLPLPVALLPRNPSTDPNWPFRTVGDFYVGNQAYSGNGVNIEFLSLENRIVESIPVPSPTNPDSTVEVPALDSLYLAYGSAYPTQMLQSANGEGVNTVMTYYHGRDGAPLVFSGTSIWDFRRQDCAALVDFVLGQLWGLSKSALYTATPSATPAATPAPARRAVDRGRSAVP